MMTEDDKVQAIFSLLEKASDYATNALDQNRTEAWNAFLLRPRGDEVEGRSTVQDTSIPDAVEAILAILSEQWDCPDLCDFAPEGPGDEDQADAEARAINTLFRSDNNGYMELLVAAKNALLFRNGLIKVWLDDTPTIESRVFPDRIAIAGLPQDYIQNVQDVDEGVRVTLSIPNQRLRFKAIEPSQFCNDPNSDSLDLQESRYFHERILLTRSQLKDMGVTPSVVDDLMALDDPTVTQQTGATNSSIQAKYIDGVASIAMDQEQSEELIECFEVHMYIDVDGDGISEMWRFLVTQRQILEEEQVSFFPMAAGAPWIVPNRFSGLSVYDKLRVTVNERTNARRQLADNLNMANNQRPIGDPGYVNMESLMNSAPGYPILTKGDYQPGFQPFFDITSNSVSFLQYMDGVRSEQVGAAMDLQAADSQSVKSISGLSAEMQLGPAEQMTGMIARNLANTMVKGILLAAHKTVREQWQGPIMFHKSGEWVETDPSQWMPRKRISLNIAMSPGEERRKIASLNELVQTQLMLIQGGAANITTNWNGLHKALIDKMRLQGLDDTEGYLIDPDSQQAQQAMQAAAQEAQGQTQAQEQMMQMQAQLENMKLELDKYKHDSQLKYDEWETRFEAQQTAEIEEAKLVTAERTARNNAQGSNGAEGSTGQNRPN